MKSKLRAYTMNNYFFYIFLLINTLTVPQVFAQLPQASDVAPTIEHDSGAWGFFFLRARLRQGIQGQLEISPRIGADFTQLQTLLIRPSFIFQINPQFSTSLGYLAMPRWDSTGFESMEHRIWEQVQGNFELNRVVLIPRVRFEQRFRGVDSNEIAHRLRLLLRTQIPILRNSSNLPIIHVILFDEVFLNLGSSPRWTESGFDQNRAFAGTSFRLNERTIVETGYMNQFINPFGTMIDRMAHLWILNFTVDF